MLPLRSQGKGSNRRPRLVTEEALAEAWARTFGAADEPSDADVADAESEFAEEIAQLERLRPSA